MTKIAQLYRSRESAIENTIIPLEYSDLAESDTKAYDQVEKLKTAVDELGTASDDYFAALYEYADDNCKETEKDVAEAGKDLDTSWAEAQVELSKLALLLGIDGNDAFQRKITP